MNIEGENICYRIIYRALKAEGGKISSLTIK